MRLTFSCLFFAVSSLALGNNPELIELKTTPENFKLAMAITKPSSRQVDTVIQLSIAYSFTNKDTCLILGRRAVDISKDHADQAIHAKALLELGDSYRIFGELDKGEKLLKEGKAIFESLKIDGQVATANNKLGALNVNKGNYEIAINYYLQALKIWEELKDSQNIIKPYVNIGAVFKNLNRNQKAEEYYEKALEWAEILDDYRARMYVYNNQAIIYNANAVTYQSKAEKDTLNASLFRDSVQFFIEKAMNKYEGALELARKLNDNRTRALCLTNLIDLNVTNGNYQEAIALSKEAEIILQDIGAITSLVSTKVNQSEAHRHLGQLKKSILRGEEALQLASGQKMGKHSADANYMLYQSYKALGVYSKALVNFEAFQEFNNKNGDAERNKAIAEVEAKFQNVQKEKEILKQRNDILELETVNAKIEKQRNYIFGGTLVMTILGILGFQLNKIRRERNDKIAFAEALIFAQEEERKRIARDLHDGIGQSLLLIKKQMASNRQVTLENQKMITETLAEVRSISRDLHPFQLEKFGITATIEEAISRVAQSTNLFITKDMDNIDGMVSAKAEIHVFRTIQEALSNVVKHAEATAAKVSIKAKEEQLIIVIRDNGKGFDHELAIVKSKSLGLRTMVERVHAINGKLKIESGNPSGTIIEISIPRFKAN